MGTVGGLRDCGFERFPFVDHDANRVWLALVCFADALVRWFRCCAAVVGSPSPSPRRCGGRSGTARGGSFAPPDGGSCASSPAGRRPTSCWLPTGGSPCSPECLSTRRSGAKSVYERGNGLARTALRYLYARQRLSAH